MTTRKTVPNQKMVRINKMETKGKIFAQIEMNTLNAAAQDLAAGAFKLWIYFSKNQHDYEFALSSKDVEETFGIKKKQYDGAVKELIEKGYLVQSSGNHYFFNENPVVSKRYNESEEENHVVPKGNNVVVPKRYNDVVPKGNNTLYQKDTRNITNNTLDITNDITEENLVGKPTKFSEQPQAAVRQFGSYREAMIYIRKNEPELYESLVANLEEENLSEFSPQNVKDRWLEDNCAGLCFDIEIKR